MSVKDMAAASKVSLRFQKDVLKLHGMGYQDTIAQGYTMKQCFAHAGVKRTRRAMGLSPRGRGNHGLALAENAHARSIPAWAGEPLLRQYQQGWNIAEANYRHFSKLVVRWLMIFDQVYSVRITTIGVAGNMAGNKAGGR